MRILLTSHTYTAIGNHAKLATLAASPNIQLLVVTPEKWHDALFTNTSHQVAKNYTVKILPTIGKSRGNFFIYRANLRTMLNAFRPDILHIEQEPDSLVTAQWLWANQRHTRTIIFTWENLQQPWKFPRNFLEQYALKYADMLIGGNDEAVALLRAKGCQKPIVKLPQLGISLQDSQQAKDLTLKNQLDLSTKFVVGFVGRLVSEKGVLDLAQATTLLPQAHLLILGNGLLYEQLHHQPNTTLCPAVPHQQVPQYLAAMDVLVLPSRTTPKWKEQFGRVLIEAMACGVPVVGSDSGAIPEVIADAGLIFPEGNITALRDCLLQLQQNPTLRAELSRKGRERVLAHYTHEQIAAQTVAIYKQLIP